MANVIRRHDGVLHVGSCSQRAGRLLAARGTVEFTQGGHVVDAATARGPVRLRLARPS